jgi:hypothetical protein
VAGGELPVTQAAAEQGAGGYFLHGARLDPFSTWPDMFLN